MTNHEDVSELVKKAAYALDEALDSDELTQTQFNTLNKLFHDLDDFIAEWYDD